MEEVLRAKLLATAALTTIVQQRVDWNARPQGDDLPAVSLELISSLPQITMDGPAAWTRARVQIDVWARTHKSSRDIANIIATALHGFRDTLSAVRIRTFIISRRGDTDTDTTGTIHRASIDALVWYA